MKAIKATGAKAFLFSYWANCQRAYGASSSADTAAASNRCTSRELHQYQTRIDRLHQEVADESGATVMPIGRAFGYSGFMDAPTHPLKMTSDSVHPSCDGSYLTAMVAYSSLLGGASPVGLARPPSGFCAVTAARASTLQGWAVRAAADAKVQRAQEIRDAIAKKDEEANKAEAEEAKKRAATAAATVAEEAAKAKASATVDFGALSKRFVAECEANGCAHGTCFVRGFCFGLDGSESEAANECKGYGGLFCVDPSTLLGR